MYDFRVLKDQLATLQEHLGPRGQDIPWALVQQLSDQRRDLITQVEELRRQLKLGSEEVAKCKREKRPTDEATTKLRELGDRIQAIEVPLRDVEEQLHTQALRIPNVPHASVPTGADAEHNVETRRWGTIPTFDFTPRSHDELGETLGVFDFERASKLTGSRFSLSYGLGAKLERALANFMLELHIQEHGYTEVLPPFMVNRAAMTGTGQLPKFEEDAFHLASEDYFLIPTAEVPLTNIYQQEIVSEADLPIRYVAHTPCFRREAGSYGQDTKGLIRVHQFNKVELVNFTHPDQSHDALEELTHAAEKVLQALKLPYRVMTLCTGDMGFSAAKTYDLEVWVPSQHTYREVSSCSNFEAFQARRAGIRYRPKQGKANYVHTLNGSALAIGRTVVAIMENYQQADGSVSIPEALQPYFPGTTAITSRSTRKKK
ncbi:MAG: serine--tRNA ligase [Nitrospirales bacterium]